MAEGRKHSLLCTVLIVLPLLMFQDSASVTIFKSEGKDSINVYARNRNIYPVTVEVQLEFKNLDPDKELPYIGVINARDNKRILRLSYTNKEQGWKFNSRYKYYMGSIFARHNDHYVYRLPFKKGLAFRLNQGYNNSFTHKDDLKYSLDFDLSEGTEVYAARDGLVVQVVEGNTKSGPFEEFMDDANYVTVLHDDGTFADYSHLKKDGVLIDTGQFIRRGQLIAYSGNTGFTTGPHLHFTVKKAKKGGGFNTIPVKFHTLDGVQELTEGEIYTAY